MLIQKLIYLHMKYILPLVFLMLRLNASAINLKNEYVSIKEFQLLFIYYNQNNNHDIFL